VLRMTPAGDLNADAAWFAAEFNPDMAASLVTSGAIDAESFRAAQGEVFATFSKIHPFLSELRTASGEADFCKHLEAVVLWAPDAEAILARRREGARAAARARRQHAAE
jgi:hypothetical protein